VITLLPGEGTFRSFLTALQALFCGSLQKFAIQGMVHSADDREERWYFGILYTNDWQEVKQQPYPKEPTNDKARAIEDFVSDIQSLFVLQFVLLVEPVYVGQSKV
jgi:hypothetical protein